MLPAERKLLYLRMWMNNWCELYPHYKASTFEVFCEIYERRHQKAERQAQEAKELAERRRSVPIKQKGNCCYYCQTSLAPKQSPSVFRRTQDHIIPKSKGGGEECSNKVTACRRCNGWKANRDLGEWAMEVTDAILGGNPKVHRSYLPDELERILINIRKLQAEISKLHKTAA